MQCPRTVLGTMAVVSEGNHTLIITLPPGLNMTGTQYLDMEARLGVVGISIAASFAVILWDYLITFKDEWRLYTASTRATWQQPSTWAYILLRYASIVASLPPLWFSTLQSQHCSLVVRLSSFAVAVVVAAAGLIFIFRVMALWKGNAFVYATLGCFYLVLLGGWFGTAWTYDADTGPPTPFNSNCILHPTAKWNSVSFGSSVLFDCVVLVLTMLKVRPYSGSGARSAVSRQVYRDSLWYFAVTAATNIAVLVVNALGPKYALLKPAVEPFSTVATTTMAQRVYLNLKLLYTRPPGSSGGDVNTLSFGFSRMTASAPRPRDTLPAGYPPAVRADRTPGTLLFLDEFKDRPSLPEVVHAGGWHTAAGFTPEASEDTHCGPPRYPPPAMGLAF